MRLFRLFFLGEVCELRKSGSYMLKLRERLQVLLDQGMSQRELAEKAGVTQTLLNRTLKEHSTPSGEDAIKLWELAKELAEPGSEQAGLGQTDAETQKNTLQRETSDANLVRPLGPTQLWPRISAKQEDKVLIPGEARLLFGWLPRAENSTIQCIGVVNSEGGRRILPRSSAFDRKIANLEKSLVNAPIRADEFATDRLRLARYVAASWSIQISYVDSASYEIRIVSPQHALPQNSEVDVFASQPDILELYPPTEDATVLHEELKQVAKEFARLLDQFAEM